MLDIDDYLTYIDNPEDVIYLREKTFPVNMRLYKTSKPYRLIIQNCCKYIEWLARKEMKGYSKPYGVSGANAAIPFNIIGVVRRRNKPDESVEVMLNPTIIEHSEETIEANSNCGSIRLKEPIKITRYKTINIEFYTIEGQKITRHCTKRSKAMTIQHEIDHNLGILITDRRVK